MRKQAGRRTALRHLAALLAAGALALAGCGSSDGGSGSAGATPHGREGTASPTSFGGAAEREAPKGASPVERSIYREFPPPKPDPGVKGSARAIERGEAACEGLSPLEVKARFYAKAEKRLLPAQKKMVGQLERFAKNAKNEGSFPAGQIAALVYEQSLPSEKTARFGYQGCVYALARGLERQLAAERK